MLMKAQSSHSPFAFLLRVIGKILACYGDLNPEYAACASAEWLVRLWNPASHSWTSHHWIPEGTAAIFIKAI